MAKTSILETHSKIPKAFIWRRLHSLMGLWLVLYLFEHLLVNSQAAWIFEDKKFVDMVNSIHDLPYLKAIELLFLGIPFFIHMYWGVQYLITGKYHSFKTDGTKPSLTEYRRNHAYSWQRITSWILLVGILAHVVHMRFYDYPLKTTIDGEQKYLVPVKKNNISQDLKNKLDVQIVAASNIDVSKWNSFLSKRPDQAHPWVVIAKSPGAAFLVVLREVFSNPIMVIFYALLVLAAAYHGLNGLWTFLITWGITLTKRSQMAAEYLSWTLMFVVVLLGFMATIGTFIVAMQS